jgi:hypothetical protein
MHRTHNTADSSTLWPSFLRSIRARIDQVVVISSALAIELRCKLDLKAFEFNCLCTHNIGSSEENRPPISALKGPHPGRQTTPPPICALAKCAIKTKSPRFVSEAQKDYALLMCPRYMNVPSPAPCHVNVAGVGKQSVWGLRIIVCGSP